MSAPAVSPTHARRRIRPRWSADLAVRLGAIALVLSIAAGFGHLAWLTHADRGPFLPAVLGLTLAFALLAGFVAWRFLADAWLLVTGAAVTGRLASVRRPGLVGVVAYEYREWETPATELRQARRIVLVGGPSFDRASRDATLLVFHSRWNPGCSVAEPFSLFEVVARER